MTDIVRHSSTLATRQAADTKRTRGQLVMYQRLTDKIVRALEPPVAGNRITYDSAVAGFGVRITAAGARAFILNYRVKATGLERRLTIGSYPDWIVTAARERAKELKREIDSGGDPLGEEKASRDAPTVADLCARFKEEHLHKLRPKTQALYRLIVDNELVPALGKLKVAAVDFEHVDRLHRKIARRAPILANRTLAVLSKMFALAIRWRLRPDNPCKGVERNREHARKRYMTSDELARLTKTLVEHPDQQVANIFRLLLLTGARSGEVLSATWDQFNLKEGLWSKPPISTKQNAPHQIPLSAPARQLVASLPNDGELLFPGRGGQRRTNLNHSWGQICKAAEIAGLRIHDLRHSYASTLVSAGFSLPVIGDLLGHSQPQTTARYAHLFDDVRRKATEAAARRILAPSTKSSGEVKTFPARAGK
jgi:integrase